MAHTASRQLAELLLGSDLDAYVNVRRERGVSWRQISLDLRDETDRRVDISHETLRAWFGQSAESAA